MTINDLNELDFNNISEWPTPIKAAAVLLICIALGGAVYYFDTKDQIVVLKSAQAKELQLRSTFENKQRRAASLPYYRELLAQMRERLADLLQLLPSSTEVPALLVDVSQTGLAVGLEFELFQPQNEQNKDFYAELPISVRVTGSYHNFGRFVSGLAALSRIVTIHDIKISGSGAKGGDARLSMQATLKTYRYLEEGAK